MNDMFEPKIVGEEEKEENEQNKKKLLDNDELNELDEKIVEPVINMTEEKPKEIEEASPVVNNNPVEKKSKNYIAIYVALAIILAFVVLYFVVFKG